MDMRKVFLLLFLVLSISVVTRLYRIDSPLVDRHNFRQTDTWVISQKIVSGKATFFAPRFNHAPDPNNTERYFMAEVPFYEVLIGWVYQLSSSMVAVRFVNIILTVCISVALFFIAAELFKDTTPGWIAAIVIHFFPGFSFWGRAVTPDILSLFGFSVSVLAALLAKKQKMWFLPLAIGYSVAVLSKPSYVLFAPLLVFLLFIPDIKQVLRTVSGSLKNAQFESFLIKAVFSLAIPLGLLFIWRMWIFTFPDSVQSDPDFLTLMHGHQGYLAFWRETQWFRQFLFERLFGELLTPFGGFLFVTGLVLLLQKIRNFFSQTLLVWVLLCVVLTTFLSWGTRTHDYYALPWVLPASLIVGYCLGRFITTIKLLLRQSGVAEFFGVFFTLYMVVLGTYFGIFAWWKHIQAYADFGPYVLWEESMQQEYEDIRYIVGKDDKVLTILEEYSPFVLNELDREGTVMGLRFFESCPNWQTFNLRMSDYLEIEAKEYILVDIRQNDKRLCNMSEFVAHFWARYPVVYEGPTFTVFRVVSPELRVKGENGLLWLELWNMEPNVQLEVGGIPGRDEALIFLPQWQSVGGERGYISGPFEAEEWKSFKLYWEAPKIIVESPEWAVSQDGWVIRK